MLLLIIDRKKKDLEKRNGEHLKKVKLTVKNIEKKT